MRTVLLSALCIGATLFSTAAQAQQNPDGMVQALVARIRATITALPAGSGVAAYQAQIASTVESDGPNCEVVRSALGLIYGTSNGNAQAALGRLRNDFSRCSYGTASIGGASGLRPAGVGFSVGGGSSNYTN
jgi:hypothetical protein